MPLGIFRNWNVSTANVVGVPHGRGDVRVLLHVRALPPGGARYTPLEVGLAFLPSMVIWGSSSLLLSDRLVMRFGIRPPLIAGLALMAVGLLLLVRTPVEGTFLIDVLPATLAVGLGAGIGFNPILLAAMSGVAPTEAGLASASSTPRS